MDMIVLEYGVVQGAPDLRNICWAGIPLQEQIGFTLEPHLTFNQYPLSVVPRYTPADYPPNIIAT